MADEEIPQVNLPEESGLYKVIQIEEANSGTAYLRFSKRRNQSCERHSEILSDFADEVSIDLVVEGRSDSPKFPENSSYRLVGAGVCQHDALYSRGYFWGDSSGYEIGIDEEHLGSLRKDLKGNVHWLPFISHVVPFSE
ncbi:hypothetical protein K8R33_05180 [archaeon]|nr:hypothetical protein [archaeon]